MAEPPTGDVWDWLAATLETHVVARFAGSDDDIHRELMGKRIRQITSTCRRWTGVAWAQSELAGSALHQVATAMCVIVAQLATAVGLRIQPALYTAQARTTSAVGSLELYSRLINSWNKILELVKWLILFVATGGVNAVSPPSRSAADLLAAAEQDLARPDEPIAAHPADPASLEVWVPPTDPASAAHASAEGCRGELLLIARRLPSTLLENLVAHMSSIQGTTHNSSKSSSPSRSAGSPVEARAVAVALLACDVGLRCPDSLRCVPTLRSVGQQRLTLKLVESLDVLAPLPFLLALDQSGGSLTAAALTASMWHLKLARAMASALEQSLTGGWHDGVSGPREMAGYASPHGLGIQGTAVNGSSSGGNQMRRRHLPSQPLTNAAASPQPFFYWTDSAAAVDKVLACLPPDDSAFHARRAIQRRLFAAAHRLFQLGKSSYSSTQHGPNHGPATGSCEEGSCRSSSPRLPCAAVALVVVQLLLRPPSWALRSAPGADGAASSSGGSSSSTPSEAPSGEGHGAVALARGLRLAQALSNGADPDALLNPNSDEQQQEKAGGAHVSDEVRQLSKGGPPSLAELQVVLDHLRLARRLMNCLEKLLLAAMLSSSGNSSSSSGSLKSTGYFMGGSRAEGGVGAGGISSEASSALAPAVGCLVEGLEPWWSWQRNQASDAVTQRLKQSIAERQALEKQNKANNSIATDESAKDPRSCSTAEEAGSGGAIGSCGNGHMDQSEAAAFEMDPTAMLDAQRAHSGPPPVVSQPPPVAVTAAAARSAIKTAASTARCLDGRGRWLIPILDHALDKVTTAMAPHRAAVRVQLTGVKAIRAILRARATANDDSSSSSSTIHDADDRNTVDSQVAVSPGCVRRCAGAAVRALMDHCLAEEEEEGPAPNFDTGVAATTASVWLRPGVDARELLRACAQLLSDLAQVQSTQRATTRDQQQPAAPPRQPQTQQQLLVAKARKALTPGGLSTGETATNATGNAAPEAAMAPAGASYAAVAASGGLSALADAMLVADSAAAAQLLGSPTPTGTRSSGIINNSCGIVNNSSGIIDKSSGSLSLKELENALEDFFEVRRAGLSVFAKHDVLDAKALPRYGGKAALKACFAALLWTNRERTRLQRAKLGYQLQDSVVVAPLHRGPGDAMKGMSGDKEHEEEEDGEDDDEVAELKFEWAAPVGRPPGVTGQPKPANSTLKDDSGSAAQPGEGLSTPSEATSLAGLAVMATVQLLLRVAASDMLPLHVAAAERDIGRIQAEVGLHNNNAQQQHGAGLPGTGVSGPAVQYVDTARWWFEQARGLEHLDACLGSFGPGSTSAALDHAGQWARRTLHNHWPEYLPAVEGHGE